MKVWVGILFCALAACSSGTHPTITTTTTTQTTTTPGTPESLEPVVPPQILNPAVTQATIRQTICVKGWTATVRPPLSYTEPLKRKQLRASGASDQRLGDYEEDHAIPLELGGNPGQPDPSNLWPEPHTVSFADDKLENSLHANVCSTVTPMPLATAQILMYNAKKIHGFHG